MNELRTVSPTAGWRRHFRIGRVGYGALLIALIALGIAWLALQISNARCFVLTGPVVCRVQTDKPMVALTFDDGPTDAGVAAIVPILQHYQAKATFFLIGEDIALEPDAARALIAAGYEIGNHSYSHDRMIFKSAAFYDRELERTDHLIQALGASPGLFRPPYGKKLVGLPRAVNRRGLVMVTWDVEDPITRDPAIFARAIVDEAKPGSIILLHAMYPSNETARRALPLILQGLQAKGLQVVTVGTLIREASARP